MAYEALDFYDIDALLTEEEKMVRDASVMLNTELQTQYARAMAPLYLKNMALVGAKLDKHVRRTPRYRAIKSTEFPACRATEQ